MAPDAGSPTDVLQLRRRRFRVGQDVVHQLDTIVTVIELVAIRIVGRDVVIVIHILDFHLVTSPCFRSVITTLSRCFFTDGIAQDILFLDEPTSGIDPFARRVFWHRITKIAQNGTTIIVTTHFLDEAEYCDRIMIQDAGTMIALGTPQEVRAQGGSTAKEPLSMEQVFINIVLQARGGHA